MSEYLRQNFRRVRSERLRSLESAMGISLSTLNSIRDTYGRGMEKGTVRFVPGKQEAGVLGVLHFISKENGVDVDRTHNISNPNEAAFLIGLQQEADTKRES